MDFWRKIPSVYKIFIAFLVVVFVPFLSWAIFGSSSKIPDGFLNSRRESAVIAGQIVDLSSEATDKIKDIERLERSKKYIEAIDKLNLEVKQVASIRAKGSDLLARLNDMTESLSAIKSEKDRELAFQAINYETNIVSHLISYENNTQELLRLIVGNYIYGKNLDPKPLVDKINNEGAVISDLNSKFNETMDKLGKSQ